jgi:hypothetical protein
MTDPNVFLQRVQEDVLGARTVSKPTCEAFADLPPQTQRAYARALRFLGCASVEVPRGDAATVSEMERIRASRLMLLALYLDSGTPAWSSWKLDRLLEAVMGAPGGSVGDLLHALYELLEDHPGGFTEPMGNLIKTLVIQSFVQHRASFDAADLSWMAHNTAQHATPAQAYLALLAVPPEIMQPICAVAILRKLVSTPYWKEAIDILSDNLNHEEARALLREWSAEGIARPYAEDVQRILGIA